MSKYWSKPSIKNEGIRVAIYFLTGFIRIFPMFFLFLITLGWFSPGAVISSLASWAVNGSDE